MLLQVKNLIGGYTKTPVLKDISFTIENKEIVGLIGLNGAGKSTIIKHIINIMKPHSGEIRLNDKDFFSDRNVYQKDFSYIPETPILYEELTLEEHMQLTAMIYELPEDEYKRRSNNLLKQFNMESRAKLYPANFSKGMKQKVMIMCAFLIEPSLYIIDEPFLGLDPIAINSFLEIMEKMKEQGSGILMSTHILATAEKYCDKFIILDNGKILAIGTLREIQEKAGMLHSSLDDIFISLIRGNK